MKQGLALFDFDGTITTKDTLFELIKFQKGKLKFWIGMIWLLPIFVLFKIKIIPAWKAKEIVLAFFFARQPVVEFQKSCDLFTNAILPGMLRREALEKIEHHLKNNDRIIVVSASAYQWVQGWCDNMKIELIATHLDQQYELITGKLKSLNCNDEEKVRRIKEHLNLNAFSPIYAYGNSTGDKPMLALADFPFYQKF